MNIAVYLGARDGARKEYQDCAREVGALIGESHNTLVYGASNNGLMKILSDSCLDHGGYVIGVSCEFFREVINPRIQEKEIYPTIALRRSRMIELSDVYIALPGGVGTLDEITEAIDYCTLDQKPKKVILLNLNGYYDPLKTLVGQMVKEGFLSDYQASRISFVPDVEALKHLILD